ncbi:jg17148 [Pararge aegeria aegeria]|uniref:Jg17148 protein n=1 Tax=Pararge aegeria aegeria TaxID=348720 RepID=A0A8S4QMX1_9NEOP|nr:jg17148 [Pararge aegeria aegeria]
MGQENAEFLSLLTNDQLNTQQLDLIESRFGSEAEAEERCPSGIRLFNDNHSVEAYNLKTEFGFYFQKVLVLKLAGKWLVMQT